MYWTGNCRELWLFTLWRDMVHRTFFRTRISLSSCFEGERVYSLFNIRNYLQITSRETIKSILTNYIRYGCFSVCPCWYWMWHNVSLKWVYQQYCGKIAQISLSVPLLGMPQAQWPKPPPPEGESVIAWWDPHLGLKLNIILKLPPAQVGNDQDWTVPNQNIFFITHFMQKHFFNLNILTEMKNSSIRIFTFS